MKRQKGFVKRLIAAGMAVLMLAGLVGCGKKKETAGEPAVQRTEILTGVYRGTVYPLPEGFSAEASSAASYDPETDTVTCFASGYFEDEETGEFTARNSIFRLGQDGVREEIPLELGTNAYIQDGFADGDGLVLLAQTWDEDSGKSGYSLIRWRPEGPEGSEETETVGDLARFFPSAAGADWFNIGHIAADGDGRIYLSSDQEIALLNPDMTPAGTVSCSTWINGMAAGADGIVYVSGWFDTGEGIAPVDPATKNVGKPVMLPGAAEFCFGPGYDLYLKSETGIFGVTFAEDGGSESEVVLDYINSNLNPDETRLMRVIDRDTFLMTERADEENWTSSPALYRHAEDVDLSEITVIELAYGDQNMSYRLPAKVVAFNKAHPDMRIVVTDYSRLAADDDWEGGMKKLASDMVTGIYRPDIVAGSPERQDLAVLRNKMLYRDLLPFMEKDDVLNPDNLFGCVKSALSVPASPDKDAVWCLCGSIQLQSLLSTKEILGRYAGQDGWSIGEFLDFAENLPDGVELGEAMSQDTAAVYLGGSYGMFVDEEAGTCSFDGEDFVRWLRFLSSLPKDWQEMQKTSLLAQTPWEEQYGLYHQGKVALKEEYFHDFGDFLRLEMEFGTKDYRLIGFPAKEGESGTRLRTDEAFAVTTWCAHPEAAWEVVKAFCDGSLERWRNGIPATKTMFEETAAEYRTYEFEFHFDGSASWGTMDPDHPRTEADLDQPGILTYFTAEDEDRIRAILDKPAVLLADSMSEELTAIVNEELSALSAGVSTPEDCAKKIQSRASIWLAENR